MDWESVTKTHYQKRLFRLALFFFSLLSLWQQSYEMKGDRGDAEERKKARIHC